MGGHSLGRIGGGGHGGHGGLRHVGGRGDHRHWHQHYVRWHRPLLYGGIGYAAYETVRPTVAANPCTCLTKEYTPEGAVLFRDRCTDEAAMNPPLPQKTGENESEAQPAYTAQYVQPRPANALPQDPIPQAR